MFKRNIIIIVSLFLSLSIAAAQPKKIYEGPFHLGQARYEYYEGDEGQRIYDGNFSFSLERTNKDNQGVDVDSRYSVKGEMKNGKQEGDWIYEYNEDGGFSYNTGSVRMLVIYDMGQPVNYRFGYSTGHGVESFELNLNNGNITEGKYDQEFFPDWSCDSGVLEFYMNKDGRPDGEWRFTQNRDRCDMNNREQKIYISKYSNGILKEKLIKNNATGEIIKVKIETTESERFPIFNLKDLLNMESEREYFNMENEMAIQLIELISKNYNLIYNNLKSGIGEPKGIAKELLLP